MSIDPIRRAMIGFGPPGFCPADVGLILAAPLTSAVTRIASGLTAARRPKDREAAVAEPVGP